MPTDNATFSVTGPATVAEDAGTATYTVTLSAQPAASVTVEYATSDVTATAGADYTAKSGTLTFTTVNWDTAQTVPVTITDDAVDDDDETFTFTLSNPSAGTVLWSTAPSQSTTITDDDTLGLTYTAAPTTLTVDTPITALTATAMSFTGTPGYAVTTGSLPAGLNISDTTGAITGTPTAANTSTTTVTVTATAGTQTATADITFPAVGKGTLATPANLAVKPNTLAQTAFTVTWGAVANAAGYTATAAPSDGTAVTGTVDTTGTKPEAAFTDLTANTAYTVSVTATGNANYNNSAAGTLSVTTLAPPAFTLTPPALRVNEGTTSTTYTVELATQPTGTVTVAVAGSGDVSVSPASLTFTATTWSTAQTVTVRATSDDDVEDDTAVISHTASGGGYGSVTGSVSVTVYDDDIRGVTVSETVLTVLEGASESYTVVLDTQPTGDVTVTVGGTTNSDVTVDTDTDTAGAQDTLTFSNSNWSTAQTVTVAAATDTDAANDAVVTLTHAVSGADYESEVAPSVAVTIIEKDTATFSVSGPATLAEDAGTVTYTVSLSKQPSGNVTVKYVTADGTATAGSDYTAARGTLTFTQDNWSTNQTVSVTITDDTVDDDEEDFTFTLSEASTRTSLSASPSVATTITDNDDPAVTVSFGTGTYSVTEGGTVSVAVTLSAGSERLVTIPLTATNGTGATSGDYSGVPSSVTFARTETSQTLTFSATDDAVDEDNETVTLGFGTQLPPRLTAGTTSQAAVTIMDDDSRGLMLSATSLAVNENAFGTYTVELRSQPTTNVTVTVGGATGDVSVDTSTESGDQTTLTFTPTNWSTPRMVTVAAADDDDAINDAAVTLTHTASGGDYASLTGPSLSVTITENDSRGVTLSTTTNTTITTLTVNEEETESYTVVLDSEPTGDVTVTIGGTYNTDITVDTDPAATGDQTTLTFTPTNWSTPRMVMVVAADDDDAANDAAVTLTHTASGGDYASLTGPSLSVTITENDSRGVTLSTTTNTTITTLTVNEEETESYTVVLDSEPTGDVTVTIGGTYNTDITVDTDPAATGDQTTLTFTPTNWSTPRMVMVVAADDDDAVNDAVVTLTHTASGGDYASLTGPSLSVTIIENDAATFSATGPATIAEGAGTATYTVSLSVRPSANVTINYATADGTATAGSDYTAASGTLTFRPSNWDTDQMVPVTITDDTVDDDDETFTFTLSNPGSGAVLSASPSLSTTITDNDVPALTVSFGATIPPQTWTVDVSVDLTLPEATGGNGTISYELTPDLPSGVMLDRSTRTLSGAPTAAATATTYTWRATDSDGNTAALTFSVTVSPAPNLEATLRYPAAPTTLTVGTTITPLPATTTGLTAPITYAVSPDLPAGLTLSTTTGEISGTPTTMNPDGVTVTATTDDGETATANITFPAVAAAPPLTEATLRYPAAPTTLTVGTTITPLPATTTGLTAPITYAVSQDLPAGLTLSTTTGEISGTPTTMNPDGVTVTVTATTDDGETATANITFPPVAAAPPLTEEKRDEVNTEILPSIINQVAENQVAIITSRSEIISSGLNRVNLSMEEMVTDVADYLFSHHQEIQANGFDWRQALSGKNFSFTLADTSTPQSGMDDGKPSSSGSGPLSFWGAIDYSSLQDNIETISLDGDTLSFNFGVDKEFTSDLVLGILLSIANSEFDLTGGFTGTYEVDLSTLNPYISWEASEDLSLWASVGYGRGQVDLTETSGNAPISQGGNFTRFSAGGRFQLWQSQAGTGLALKLDGTTAHFLEADVQRSRLATELSHDFSIESGVLNTALELGLLMSSADESAAELVGGLHWQGDAGLSSSIRSRILLGGGDRQEWGIGGALRYTAGGDGEGLMMALEPSFGISNPQLLPDLWQVTTSNPATTTAAPTAQLNAKLAYGFPTTGGLLTPYTDFSFSDTTSTYGAGLRYGLSTGLDLDLKGTHKTSTTEDSQNSIFLELEAEL